MDRLFLNLKQVNSFNEIKVYDYSSFEERTINYSIIEDILYDPNLLKKVFLILLDEEKTEIEFDLLTNEPILIINKIVLLNALLEYITKEDFRKIEVVRVVCKIANDLFYQKRENRKGMYEISVDLKLYQIPISYFYDFLEIEDSLYSIFLSMNVPYYRGIPLEVFIYSLNQYLEKNHFLEKHLFPNTILERIKSLKMMQVVDYESINQMVKTSDPFLDRVELNSNLKSVLLPNGEVSDKLKYIIEIYIKLCKMFIYDENYYIDPLSDLGMRHTKISYLKKIDPENNKIVCFEFTAIFGFLLNKLGICYEVVQKSGTSYGFRHNYLIFRYGKFLIKVDPISSILDSDLTTVKIKSPLVGLTCFNKSKSTRQAFKEIVRKCYVPSIFTKEVMLPANKFVYSYSDFPFKIKELMVKLDFIFKKVKEQPLDFISEVAYLKSLIKEEFTSLELNLNISNCIVIKNTDPVKLIVVITLNEVTYMNLDNYYLIYDGNLSFISKEDLRELFLNKTLEYLNEKKIPGIKSK